MRIKIVSDGTPHGTQVLRVLSEDTGEIIEGVKSVSWKIGTNGLARAKLIVDAVPVNVFGEVPDKKKKR